MEKLGRHAGAGLRLSKDEARIYGPRGRAAQVRDLTWNVENALVTTQQIAVRIDRSKSTALMRLKREQAKPGPLTWAGLESVE